MMPVSDRLVPLIRVPVTIRSTPPAVPPLVTPKLVPPVCEGITHKELMVEALVPPLTTTPSSKSQLPKPNLPVPPLASVPPASVNTPRIWEEAPAPELGVLEPVRVPPALMVTGNAPSVPALPASALSEFTSTVAPLLMVRLLL